MPRHLFAFATILTLLLVGRPALAASVCVDPGHGGSDPGAQGCGLSEASINLSVGTKLRDLLEANGITTYMTRTNDSFVGLTERAAYANAKGVDRFASVHSNAGGGTGIETFCMEGSTSSTNGWKMASAIQTQMLAVWPLPDRGVKTANFAVLRETAMPATLSELAFIDKCSPDAEYLGDDGHRDAAACAHLKAITSHLGLAGTCSTSPSTQGTATGVVFEDKGSGTDDMSTLLPGATVAVQGGPSTTVGADAVFTFDLEAGTYTIEATLQGYDATTVSCAVAANDTKWCSIGLTKSAPGQDAGAPMMDAAVEDTGTGFPSVDDAGTTDAGTIDAGASSPSGAAFWEQDEEGGCGCSTVPSKRSSLLGVSLLAGLLILLARRRRLGLAVASLALVGCSQESEPDPAPTRARFQPVGVTTPSQAEGGVRLENPERLLAPGYLFPTMSPDGRWVAVTRAGLEGLWVASSDGGSLTQLSHARRAGYLPVWRRDSDAIGLRAGTRKISAFTDLQGREAGPFAVADGVSAWQTEDDHIVVRRNGQEHVVDEDKDKYFAPVVSHDGAWVAYTGITLGIHLYSVDRGITVQLGRGTHPSLSADGRWLAFERTDDDGERLIASDLYVCDLTDPAFPVFNVTRTPDEVERTPSLSGDGGRIAYVKQDGVYVATLGR